MHHFSHKIRGFSLIELVIIMIVVAILAVMPFYNWPGTSLNVNAQARQFADDIRYAQSLAMAQTQRYRIVQASATSYQILNGAGTPVTFATGSTTMILNSGISFGAWNNLPSNLIAFDGRGTPYLDTSVPGTALVFGTAYSISITGGGNTHTVSVTPITGRVLVQ